MVRIIFIFIMLFLSVVGFCDVLHKCKELILKPKKKPTMYYIVELDGENDADTLCWLADRICWYGNDFFGKVFAVKSSEDLIESEEYYSKKGIDFMVKDDFHF